MSRVLVLLGNGFSMDLMNTLCKDVKEINLNNLFALGENVIWPGDGNPGFLSYKHCENLWTLGVRPNITAEQSNQIIESIISCANLASQKDGLEDKIYIKAYKELESYLVSLFTFYTEKAKVDSIPEYKFRDWGWYKFFNKLNSDTTIESVDIISLNYDIWLEQLFKIWNIKCIVSNFEPDNPTVKFKLYKPHGSIGFQSKVRVMDKEAFSIKYNAFENHGTSDFTYEINKFDGLNTANAIIPPAGDSNRMKFNWAKDQRISAVEASKKITKDDKVLLCGISYWHVDRTEIDQYLTAISDANVEVAMVNPYPPNDLTAVLMTLFKNFYLFTNSNNLIK